jgi:23S rRNA pseudouridine1911/1915/1917 synthase
MAGGGVSRVEVTVGEGDGGMRLDAWLAGAVADLSRSRAKALITGGSVAIGGATIEEPKRPVKPGERVVVLVPPPLPAEPKGEEIPLEVVHEDDDLIVIDKPAGLVVHPGAGAEAGTLVNALLGRVKDLSGIGGVLRPGIVHRLDRGTSGLIVVAKDDATHRALVEQFASRTVEKEYLALVLGVPARPRGEIDAPIGRDPVHRQRMSVRAPRGRTARTTWAIEERLDGAALMRARIHTGRTHQIRVHLASIGHPVAGDAVYGGTRTPPSRRAASRAALAALARPALHSARLSFTHPATGERVVFTSPLPDDIRRVLAALREASSPA